MISYILELSLCWLVFYAIYALLLSKETFFSLNRWYLLTTALLSLAIPAIEFNWPGGANETLTTYYLQPITIGIENLETAIVVTSKPEPGFGFFDALIWLYWTGVIVSAARFLFGLMQLHGYFKKGEITRQTGYTLIISNEPHMPFSFFKYLFWSRAFEADGEDKQNIFRHEEAHIFQWHSIDVLLLEIMGIVFWCSPIIYLYKKSMKAVHEYLADDYVLKAANKKQYGRLLLRQSQYRPRIAIMNALFNSQLKKRIVMMTKTKSNRLNIWKYGLLLPALLLTTIFFSAKNADTGFDPKELKKELKEIIKSHSYVATYFQAVNRYAEEYPDHLKEIWAVQNEIAQKNNFKVKWESPDRDSLNKVLKIYGLPYKGAGKNEIFKLVEEAPLFAGCEEALTAEEKKACADNEMLQFIYANIKYPKEARKNKTEGMVVVQYVIEKDGSISGAKIVRGIGSGCDEEVLRVVGMMPKWTPGKQDGEAVRVQFNLPVKFKLE